MKLTVGYTHPDRAADYVPMLDGYRLGAGQDVLDFEVDAPGEVDDLRVAEAVFVATNAPGVVPGSLADRIRTALIKALVTVPHHYSLSVGDTVAVDGRRYAVERVGFVAVHDPGKRILA